MKNKAGNKNRSHGGGPVVILDFFGGSGTTGHAVMQRNKKLFWIEQEEKN